MHQKTFEWNYSFAKRLFDALTLITIGIVLLLNTTGVVSWSIWLNLIKLWPVWIISAGIMLIFSWSNLSRLIGALINYLIFLAVIIISITSQSLNFNFNIFNTKSNQENLVQNEVVINQNDFEDEIDSLNLNINMSIGKFSVVDSTQSHLLKVNSKYSKNIDEPLMTQELEEDSLNINFQENNKGAFLIGNPGSEYGFDVGNSKRVESLNIKLGAGEGQIDLSELDITNFVAEVGGGSLDINLGRGASPAAPLNLKVGLGHINLTLDENIGYKINYKVGLGSIQLEGQEVDNAWSKDGTYTSENFDESEKQIELNVDVGLGSLTISKL